MPERDVETYFEGTEWHSRIEGEEAPFHTADTKERAIEAGREEARNREIEHIIKNKDGTIADRSTYGNDPRDIPG
jgi:hypothetical protein